MSERMTDEELSRWSSHTPEDVWDETQRARSEEVRLLKENAEMDATIKALADALWDARAYGDTEKTACWCTVPSTASFCRRVERNPGCVAKVAALRIAGRLP